MGMAKEQKQSNPVNAISFNSLWEWQKIDITKRIRADEIKFQFPMGMAKGNEDTIIRQIPCNNLFQFPMGMAKEKKWLVSMPK